MTKPITRPVIPESSRPWGDFTLMLLTPEELDKIPDGTVLIDIFGQPCTKGPDIDKDTRMGMTAYGMLKAKD